MQTPEAATRLIMFKAIFFFSLSRSFDCSRCLNSYAYQCTSGGVWNPSFFFVHFFSLSLSPLLAVVVVVVVGFVHLMPSMLGGDIGCSQQQQHTLYSYSAWLSVWLIATHKMISLLRWLWVFSQYFK